MEEAREKAPEIRRQFLLKLEALKAGRDDDAARHQARLAEIAAAYGFRYRPAAELAKGPLRSLVERIERTVGEDPVVADALLGAAGVAGAPVSAAPDLFLDITASEHRGKSDRQMHRSQLVWRRCARRFVDAVGDVDLLTMTRDDAWAFRKALADLVAAGDLTPYSANREIYTLRRMCRTIAETRHARAFTALDGLAFREPRAARRRRQLSFSTEWIGDQVVGGAALAGLNPDARGVLAAMVNTGARPSEICALRAPSIRLSANIPHIVIAPEGRQLKTANAERVIPLAGASLEAFRAAPDGFGRYRGKEASWSAVTAKRLRASGALPSPDHRAYCLRHSFSDRLKDAGCPDAIRRQLMGHDEGGTAYGEGASLEALAGWVGKVAL